MKVLSTMILSMPIMKVIVKSLLTISKHISYDQVETF